MGSPERRLFSSLRSKEVDGPKHRTSVYGARRSVGYRSYVFRWLQLIVLLSSPEKPDKYLPILPPDGLRLFLGVGDGAGSFSYLWVVSHGERARRLNLFGIPYKFAWLLDGPLELRYAHLLGLVPVQGR
jgi:hypothetical protein